MLPFALLLGEFFQRLHMKLIDTSKLIFLSTQQVDYAVCGGSFLFISGERMGRFSSMA